jgi:hypothetical protein
MKSLALCSNDFYNNIPDWLATYETTSYISGISNFNSIISSLINNNNISIPSNNLTYEEYDYSSLATLPTLSTSNNSAAVAASAASAANAANAANATYNSVGDDLMNDVSGSGVSGGDDNSILNTSIEISDIPTSGTSAISTINPSNNFLLYYYVEYM